MADPTTLLSFLIAVRSFKTTKKMTRHGHILLLFVLVLVLAVLSSASTTLSRRRRTTRARRTTIGTCSVGRSTPSTIPSTIPSTCSTSTSCSVNNIVSLRGGSSQNKMGNPLRSILQSLVTWTEQQSPTLSKWFKQFIRTMERLTGTQLLTKESKKQKHANKKSIHNNKSKSKSKITSKTNNNNDNTVGTIQNIKAKPRKKRSKSSKTIPQDILPSKVKGIVQSSKPVSEISLNQSTKSIPKSKSSSSSSLNGQHHITSHLKSTNPNYRIQRELKEFLRDPPANLSVKVGSNIRIWIITIKGATNTVYEGETYKLRVAFPKAYPTVPPSVYFLSPPPLHEHVYTNGDICLSLLGKDWKPTMTAQSIALSILSILSSASTKSLPMDNSRHSQNKPGQYQKDWVYHDDNC